ELPAVEQIFAPKPSVFEKQLPVKGMDGENVKNLEGTKQKGREVAFDKPSKETPSEKEEEKEYEQEMQEASRRRKIDTHSEEFLSRKTPVSTLELDEILAWIESHHTKDSIPSWSRLRSYVNRHSTCVHGRMRTQRELWSIYRAYQLKVCIFFFLKGEKRGKKKKKKNLKKIHCSCMCICTCMYVYVNNKRETEIGRKYKQKKMGERKRKGSTCTCILIETKASIGLGQQSQFPNRTTGSDKECEREAYAAVDQQAGKRKTRIEQRVATTKRTIERLERARERNDKLLS
ncbi:hypothetical protein RFI_17579, partial [Reticulomyxa filosa]